MKHEFGIFEDREIILDGNQYVECLFKGCTFIFSGEEEDASLTRSSIEECRWRFVGAAKRTLDFFRNFSKAAGDEACEALIKQLLRRDA